MIIINNNLNNNNNDNENNNENNNNNINNDKNNVRSLIFGLQSAPFSKISAVVHVFFQL